MDSSIFFNGSDFILMLYHAYVGHSHFESRKEDEDEDEKIWNGTIFCSQRTDILNIEHIWNQLYALQQDKMGETVLCDYWKGIAVMLMKNENKNINKK